MYVMILILIKCFKLFFFNVLITVLFS